MAEADSDDDVTCLEDEIPSKGGDTQGGETQASAAPSSSTQGKKRKREVGEAGTSGKHSWVWPHNEMEVKFPPEAQRAKCLYCGTSLSCATKNGTSCLINHLSRCQKYPFNIEAKRKQLELGAKLGKGPKRTRVSPPSTPGYSYERYNASSIDNGISTLKKQLNSWNGALMNGDFLHMRCVAHILSLVVKKGLKAYNAHIARIRAAVRYVRSSPSRSQKFRSCVKLAKIESKSLLCLDVETRWNSTYLMLVAALKFRRAFDLMESDKNYVAEITKEKLPLASDWDFVSKLLPFLKVFNDTTTALSGSFYVTGNEYLRQIAGVGAFITRMRYNSDHGIQEIAVGMKMKYDKYWSNTGNMNLLIFVACVLDPRFKLKDVTKIFENAYGESIAKDLSQKVEKTLEAMFVSYSSSLVSRHKYTSSQPLDLNLNDMIEGDATVDAASFLNSYFVENEEDENVVDKTELPRYLFEEDENKCSKVSNTFFDC